MGKVKNVEEPVVVVDVEAEAPKKKKKKSKVAVEEEVAAVEEVAVEVTEKKKKKKKSAAVEETAVEAPVVEEAAPVEGEKKKKKKKKTTEEVAEEAVAEEEEKPAKKAKTETKEEDSDEEKDVEMAPAATEEGKGAEATPEDDHNARSVFLGNLSFKASLEGVEKDFAECGEIETCQVPLNEEGRMKGIAFITFKSVEGAKKCLEWNGQDYYGRDLKVEKREAKEGKGKGKKGKDGKKGGKKQERGEKPDNCTSVMIKNLSFDTTEDAMWEHFSAPAPKFIKLPTDMESGRVRGFAFLDFDTTEQVDEIITAYDGKDFLGRNLFIDYNAPRDKGEKGDKGGKKGGKKGDKGGKKGKDGKGKGKGKKGKDSDPSFAKNSGAIQEFKGEVTTFNDSDSD